MGMYQACQPNNSLPLSQYFELSVSPNSVIADGENELQVTATFNEYLSDEINNITFSTTGGTFENSSSPDKKSIIKPISGDKATAILHVGTKSGTFTVTGTVSLGGKTYIEESIFRLTPINPDSVMTWDIDIVGATPLRADGHSQVQITAQAVNADLNQSVTFETERGKFLCVGCSTTAVKSFSAAGTATIFLEVDNQVDDLLISASIETPNLKLESQIPIMPAHADNLFVEPDNFTISGPAGEVNFKIYMTRDVGRGEVSKGVNITTIAYQGSVANTVGRFLPVFTNTGDFEAGKPNAEAKFKIDIPNQPIDSTMPITVLFTTLRDDGTTIPYSVTLDPQ